MGIVFYEMYAREDPYKVRSPLVNLFVVHAGTFADDAFPLESQGEDFRDTLRKVCDRRTNKRPPVPPTCPPKMADLMKKCWAPDPFFRPEAKDLDTTFLDMNMRDAEPLIGDEQLATKPKKTGGMLHVSSFGLAINDSLTFLSRDSDMMYELFPKHIADALKSGQKVEPEQHEEVTVVFSEVIGFAEILSTLPPMKSFGNAGSAVRVSRSRIVP